MSVLRAPYGDEGNKIPNVYDDLREEWENRQEDRHISNTYVDFSKVLEESSNIQSHKGREIKQLAQLDLLGAYRIKDKLRYTLNLSKKRRDNHRQIIQQLDNKFDVVTRAPGSVSLIGSHGVVFGMPALWLPLPLYSMIAVREKRAPRESPGRQVDPPQLSPDLRKFQRVFGDAGKKRQICLTTPRVKKSHLKDIYEISNKEFNIKDRDNDRRPYEFYVVSEVPDSAGLGGSGSLAVGLSLALHYFYDEINPEELTLLDWWLSSWSTYSGLYEDNSNLANKEDIPDKFESSRGSGSSNILVEAPNAGNVFESIRKLAWKIENVLHGVSSGAGVHASMAGTPGYPLLYSPIHYAYNIAGDDSIRPQKSLDPEVIEGNLREENSDEVKGRAILRSVFQIANEVYDEKTTESLEEIENFLFDENSIALVGYGEEKDTLVRQEERDENLRNLYETYTDQLSAIISPFCEDGEVIDEHLLDEEDKEKDTIQAPIRSLLRIETEKSGYQLSKGGDYTIDRTYKGMGIYVLSLLGEIVRRDNTSDYYMKGDQVNKVLDLTHHLLSMMGLSEYKLDQGATKIRARGDFGCIMAGAGGSLLTFGDTQQMEENIKKDPRENLRLVGERIHFTSTFETPVVSPPKIVAADDLTQESGRPRYRYVKE